MAKVVIAIHGRGNKPPQQILKNWWKASISEGFEKLGIPVPNFIFEMVYWADIVYSYPENPNEIDKEDPYFIDEPYIPTSNEPILKVDHKWRKKILQFIENQLEKVFLNEDLSLNFEGVSDAIMYKYFNELEMYYENKIEPLEMKFETRNRLLQIINKHKYDEIFLISHSMGSIIAYDVLQFELQDQKINTFVTMGSPLGLPFIRAKIAKELKRTHHKLKISIPECITSAWLNFADLEDRIALNFDLNNDFSSNSMGIQVTDYEIINDYSVNGKKNPHKAYGYLRSKEFILQLNSFLTKKPDFFIKKLVKDIRRIGHKIKNTSILKSAP